MSTERQFQSSIYAFLFLALIQAGCGGGAYHSPPDAAQSQPAPEQSEPEPAPPAPATDPGSFSLQVQTDGADPDMPDFTAKGEDYGWTSSATDEYEFQKNILTPDDSLSDESGKKKQLFFVFSRSLGSRTILHADYFLRNMNESNIIAGKADPIQVHYDSVSGSYFIPWHELFDEGESTLSINIEQLLTLELTLSDLSVSIVHVRFRAQGPIPDLGYQLNTIPQRDNPGESMNLAYGNSRVVIATEQVQNKTSRPLRIWVNASLYLSTLRNILNLPDFSDPQPRRFSWIFFYLSDVDITTQGSAPVRHSYINGNWKGIDFPPLSTVTLGWRAATADGASVCTLPTESKTVTWTTQESTPICVPERGICLPHTSSVPHSQTLTSTWEIQSTAFEATLISEIRVADPLISEEEAVADSVESGSQYWVRILRKTHVDISDGVPSPTGVIYPPYECQGTFNI